MDDVCYASATEITRAIRDREISATEVLQAVAERTERINPLINAVCTTDFDNALERATALDNGAGEADLPLLGVPVSIKDLTDTAGLRTTLGSTRFASRVPAQDAEVVRRIRSAGGVIFGKTNTPEFGAGINTVNELFGATRNPWDLSRSAGGSSGGAAAAVAAGLGPIAEATDHGCSVRLPAGLNGLVGLRPTPGRVPDWPSGWAYDPFSVTGPLARTVEDCELLFRVMSGPDPRVPVSELPAYQPDPEQGTDVTGWRIAWSADLGLAAVDPEVRAVCEAALGVLTEAGAHVDQATPDLSDVRTIIDPIRAMRQVAQGGHLLELPGEIDNRLVADYLALARQHTAEDVGRAEAARSRLWQRLVAFFGQYDLLATVSVQVPAYPLDQLFPTSIDGRTIEDSIEACITCYAITVTGLPAISIPVGFTAAGLPVGLQVVGRRLREVDLFRVARLFQAARPWRHRRPPLDTAEGARHGD